MGQSFYFCFILVDYMKYCHCDKKIGNGSLWSECGKLIHMNCLDEWRRHAQGLFHKCPKCKGTGNMEDSQMV